MIEWPSVVFGLLFIVAAGWAWIVGGLDYPEMSWLPRWMTPKKQSTRFKLIASALLAALGVYLLIAGLTAG